MKSVISKRIIIVAYVTLLALPFFSFAADANLNNVTSQNFSIYQPCTIGYSVQTVGGGSGTQAKKVPGSSEVECGWGDLIVLARRIMLYLIYLGSLLSVIAVAYAAFLYMSSMGNAGKVEQAHRVFTMTAIGLVFIWGGWLIVATLLKTLNVNNAFSLVNFSNVEAVKSTNQ